MVSIIIPTYNRLSYLKQTVNSILNQTYKNFEIIIVDNNSEDDTSSYIKSINIPYIHYYNIGRVNNVSTSRNYGIKMSIGDKIAFCDDDDYWENDKLEIQMHFIDKYDFVATNAYYFDDISKRYPMIGNTEHDFEVKLEYLIYSNIITTSTVLLNKKILFETGMFKEEEYRNYCEDYNLWLRICKRYKTYYISKPLVNYRYNHISISSQNSYNMYKNSILNIENYISQSEDTYLAVKCAIFRLSIEFFGFLLHFKFNEKLYLFRNLLYIFDPNVFIFYFKLLFKKNSVIGKKLIFKKYI